MLCLGLVLLPLVPVGIFILKGCYTIQPGMAKVITFAGKYMGTAKQSGMRWVNPLYSKEPISLRVRNFETQQTKVNDAQGNPVIAAAIVVWRVLDTAKAMFDVEDFEDYVSTQSEAALRALVMKYPYEDFEGGNISLSGSIEEVSDQLKIDTQERLHEAGVEVIEARISNLAYAPEIAAAMLQRQQAGAIVAARQRIVEGAVGMVEDALAMLDEREVANFSNENKAKMVSNLLVVLCGDRSAQPVVNTGP